MAATIVRSAGLKTYGVELPESIAEALDDMAILVCYGRGAVPRNGYGQREIIGDAVVEEPPRLTGQLVLLARSLLALGLDEDASLTLCRRAALDSMPEIRRRVLAALVRDDGITVAEVARRAACDRKVARMALEDLAAIGLTDSPVPNAYEDDLEIRHLPHRWFLVGDDADLVRAVFSARRWGE